MKRFGILLVGLCMMVSMMSVAQADTHWWDKYIHKSSDDQTADTTTQQSKPKEKYTGKMLYYDYRESQQFCLTPSQAFQHNLSAADAIKPCGN